MRTPYNTHTHTHNFSLKLTTSVTRLGDFESSWWQILIQKLPKYLVTFWAIKKKHNFCLNTAVAILVNFLRQLGDF